MIIIKLYNICQTFPDAYSLIIFFIKMYIIEIGQKVMASSWQGGCSIIFHISCAHCILGICALHFGSTC